MDRIDLRIQPAVKTLGLIIFHCKSACAHMMLVASV